MNVCFIQVSEKQWIETSKIIWIETIPEGGYHMVLVGYNELTASGEYAVNIERLLRAAHFGKITLEDEK